MKFRKILINTIISLISLGVGIIITELFARNLGLGNPLLYKSDSIVGYRLKPNQSKIRRNKSKVTSDYEGFRIDHTKKIDEDTKFLIFVGDSVTYGGSYIDNENIFSSKLCDLIDKNYSCLNNGINSWGVTNMGRFISNFRLYSERKPERFILVILPGDEQRNFRSFSGTPYWENQPKFPEATNEIIKFLNQKYFIPYLQKKEVTKSNNDEINQANFIQIQRELIWEELEYLLKDIKYPLDLVITPPMNWFKDPKKEKIIRTYNKLLNKFSKLDQVKKTCNLYQYLKKDFNENLYTDGVHLSDTGHKLWASKIYRCLDLENQL